MTFHTNIRRSEIIDGITIGQWCTTRDAGIPVVKVIDFDREMGMTHRAPNGWLVVIPVPSINSGVHPRYFRRPEELGALPPMTRQQARFMARSIRKRTR
jgi:hypothetical protein